MWSSNRCVAPENTSIDKASGESRKVDRLFIFLYALAMTGTWMGILTPIIVTLPLRVHEVAPQTEGSTLSLVLGLGAIIAMISNPLFGRFSDQTTSRWGMRKPWLIVGAIGSVIGVAILAAAPGVISLLLGWCVVQLSLNAVLSGMVAIFADHIPVSQRGLVSGILGICLPVGQIGGTFLAQAVASSVSLMFAVPSVIAMASILGFAAFLRDRRLLTKPKALGWLRQWLGSFWFDPRTSPDFAWAWASRFLLILGVAFVLTYQALYLMHRLGMAAEEVPRLIFISTLVGAGCFSIASLLGGKLSDLVQRRKIFVLGSAILYGAGLWAIAASDTFRSFLIGMAIAGLAQGVYFAVDLALVTDVLPARETDAAKNLGIFNIASAMPQSVAPAIAPAILLMAGGNYAWLFAVAGMSAVLGALAIIPVKAVK